MLASQPNTSMDSKENGAVISTLSFRFYWKSCELQHCRTPQSKKKTKTCQINNDHILKGPFLNRLKQDLSD
jgi:hypothetical protein